MRLAVLQFTHSIFFVVPLPWYETVDQLKIPSLLSCKLSTTWPRGRAGARARAMHARVAPFINGTGCPQAFNKEDGDVADLEDDEGDAFNNADEEDEEDEEDEDGGEGEDDADAADEA